jgi:hypothetical protein
MLWYLFIKKIQRGLKITADNFRQEIAQNTTKIPIFSNTS